MFMFNIQIRSNICSIKFYKVREEIRINKSFAGDISQLEAVRKSSSIIYYLKGFALIIRFPMFLFKKVWAHVKTCLTRV